jgi:hypothetical protein
MQLLLVLLLPPAALAAASQWPWWPSYPPPLPLWALGPLSPYRTRRAFVPYWGPAWRPPTTTTTTTERPSDPLSSCHHLPAYCSSHFSARPSLPLPVQCIDVCAVDSPPLLQVRKPSIRTN